VILDWKQKWKHPVEFRGRAAFTPSKDRLPLRTRADPELRLKGSDVMEALGARAFPSQKGLEADGNVPDEFRLWSAARKTRLVASAMYPGGSQRYRLRDVHANPGGHGDNSS
jgi:hypothetical protein